MVTRTPLCCVICNLPALFASRVARCVFTWESVFPLGNMSITKLYENTSVLGCAWLSCRQFSTQRALMTIIGFLNPENEGTLILRNVLNYSSKLTASHPRMHGAIPPLSHTPYVVYRGHHYLSASPQAFVQTHSGRVLITVCVF